MKETVEIAASNFSKNKSWLTREIQIQTSHIYIMGKQFTRMLKSENGNIGKF